MSELPTTGGVTREIRGRFTHADMQYRACPWCRARKIARPRPASPDVSDGRCPTCDISRTRCGVRVDPEIGRRRVAAIRVVFRDAPPGRCPNTASGLQERGVNC